MEDRIQDLTEKTFWGWTISQSNGSESAYLINNRNWVPPPEFWFKMHLKNRLLVRGRRKKESQVKCLTRRIYFREFSGIK